MIKWKRAVAGVALTAGLAGVGGAVVATVAPVAIELASAHANGVSGTPTCVKANGTYFVVWTITNDFPTTEVATVTAATPVAATPSSVNIDALGSGTVTQAGIPGTATSAALTVSGVWSDDYSQPNGNTVALGGDCIPPPVQIDVCRDGQVLTINAVDRQDSDTDAPCVIVTDPTTPPTDAPTRVEVCRDGNVVNIAIADRLATDKDVTEPCVADDTVPPSTVETPSTTPTGTADETCVIDDPNTGLGTTRTYILACGPALDCANEGGVWTVFTIGAGCVKNGITTTTARPVPATTTPTTALPATGKNTGLELAIALTVLLLGLGCVLITRRRHTLATAVNSVDDVDES